jgi:hypothetical protein
MQTTTPNPGQPDQRPYDQEDTPAQVVRHQQPRDTLFVSWTAVSKGKKDGASCQVASRSDAKLSTMEKGSTDEVVGVLLEEREIRLVLEMLRPLSAFGAGAEAIVKVVVDLRPGEVDYLALRVADATMK